MKPSPAGPPRQRPAGTVRCAAAAVVIPLFAAVVFLLLLVLYLPRNYNFRLPDYLRQYYIDVSSTLTPAGNPELRVFVGVITMVTKYEVRHLQRLLNSFRPPPASVQVDVRFVICRPTHDEDRQLAALEVVRYGDLMFLDCLENVNGGKTLAFFSTVAAEFRRSNYDYVMKTDDDTYIRYPELVESLMPLPRKDLYYGHMVPASFFHPGDPLFMAGMGYILSWDLVEWIERSDFAKNNSLGSEDTLVGLWLEHGGKGKNMYDTKPSSEQLKEWRGGGDRILDKKATQYDVPWPPYRFMPWTVSVHRMKNRAQWAQVLRYFNVTPELPPFQWARFFNSTAS